MKKVFNLIMVVALSAIVFQSCKSKPSEKEVQTIANDFFKALANEDYDKAKSLGNDETDQMIEQFKMFSSMIPDSLQAETNAARERAKNATLTFGKTSFNEEGTEAKIEYTSSEFPDRQETVTVKKIEKEWLVDMNAGMPTE